MPSCLELARELGNAGTSIQSRYNRGTLLKHLDAEAYEFFATPEAKEAVRQKVAALFPAHEVEKFTELFWQRIQSWRSAGCP